MKKAHRKLHHRVHHYFLPHRHNNYIPRIFSRRSLATLALVMILIEGAYLMQVQVLFQNTGFLATVLPAALTDLTNTDRLSQGLPALVRDPELDRVAQMKVDDMAAKGYFAHKSPDGKTPWYWLEQADYPYSYAGENLAVDFTDSSDVERAWMNSPTHRENILKAQYTHIGIAVAQGVYEGKEVTFVAQFFASRKAVAVSRTVERATQNTDVAPTEIATVEPVASSQVLGTQTKTAQAPKTEAPVPESKIETTTETVSAKVAVAATSPMRTLMYLLTGMTAVIALCLTIAILVHVRRRYLYMEMVGGGVALIALAAGIMWYDVSVIDNARVPESGQAASVVQSL